MSMPVLIRDGSEIKMERVQLKKGRGKPDEFDESWIQNIIINHPEVLPTGDFIEKVYSNPILIGKEISPKAGSSIDGLFITPNGFPVIVETKLWRSPEAKREVVAQIIDYAMALTHLSFGDLDSKVKNLKDSRGRGIIELMEEKIKLSDVEKKELRDKIGKNMRTGNMLLLIVGDGIREEVRQLTEDLQKYAHLQFTLALVELQIYKTGKEQLIVPRIVERTKEIIRATVTVGENVPSGVRVEVPEEDVSKQKTVKRFTIEQDKLFESLNKTYPGSSDIAKKLLEDVERIGLRPDWKQGSFVIKLDDPLGSEKPFSLFRVDTQGNITVADALMPQLNKVDLLSLAKDYKNSLLDCFTNSKPIHGDKKLGIPGIQLKITDLREEGKYKQFLELLEKHVDIIQNGLQNRKKQ